MAQGMRLGAAALLVAWVGVGFARAQDSDRGKIVKVQLKTGPSFLGELLSETGEEVRWLDLKTGEAQTARKADLITFEKQVPASEIAQRIGEARYTGWQIRKKLGLSDHSGKVLEASRGTVKISLGQGDGVKPGQRLRVYRVNADVTDPDTGETLGEDRETVALVEVEEVQAAFCTAKIASGIASTPEAGDLARIEPPNRKVAVVPPPTLDGEVTTQSRAVAARWTSLLKHNGVPMVESAGLPAAGPRRAGRGNGSPQQLGRQLGADYLLTGQLSERGIATMTLIEVATGEILLTVRQTPPAGRPGPRGGPAARGRAGRRPPRGS